MKDKQLDDLDQAILETIERLWNDKPGALHWIFPSELVMVNLPNPRQHHKVQNKISDDQLRELHELRERMQALARNGWLVRRRRIVGGCYEFQPINPFFKLARIAEETRKKSRKK